MYGSSSFVRVSAASRNHETKVLWFVVIFLPCPKFLFTISILIRKNKAAGDTKYIKTMRLGSFIVISSTF